MSRAASPCPMAATCRAPRRTGSRGRAQVIGWSFRATLRQSFRYDTYPFDRHFFWVRVFPADQTHNIVLTPDFASYSSSASTGPAGRPAHLRPRKLGRQADLLQLPHRRSTTPTWASLRSTRPAGYPELYYTVGMSRQISARSSPTSSRRWSRWSCSSACCC